MLSLSLGCAEPSVGLSNDILHLGYYPNDLDRRRVESVEFRITVFFAHAGTESHYEQLYGMSQTDWISASGLRLAGMTTGTLYYYHHHSLGSTPLMTYRNGKVVFSETYQPFGQDNGTPTGSETYKFTGKPYSSTTGLYYHFQRWYDPEIGRFTSRDPIAGFLSDPQSLNPYVYVENTPTTLTDQTGMYNDYGPCTWTGGWGSCIENNLESFGGWYQAQRPEVKQVVGLKFAVGLTVATAGTAALPILAAGAVGFGLFAGGYAAYTYATGEHRRLEVSLNGEALALWPAQ